MTDYTEQAKRLKRASERCRELEQFEMEKLLFAAAVSIEELVALLNAARNALLDKIEEQRNAQEQQEKHSN